MYLSSTLKSHRGIFPWGDGRTRGTWIMRTAGRGLGFARPVLQNMLARRDRN